MQKFVCGLTWYLLCWAIINQFLNSFKSFFIWLQAKKGLHYLYIRGNPTEIDIDKIATIVAEESIGLVNIIDVNGL